jgi:serine/threonine protein phosphatase 1
MPQPVQPGVPEGSRVYAFGDVHGRDDLLAALLAEIGHDVRRRPLAKATVVGIGDYIDRGPWSRQVVERLVAGVPGCAMICLRGNHEQMLLDFLEDPIDAGPHWLSNGGDATLRSYDVEVGPEDAFEDSGLWSMRNQFARSIPPAHLMLVQRTAITYETGGYLFVHAGVRLGRPLAAQTADDLLWIRNGFSDVDAPFERFVVHGHTPVDAPFLGRCRINLDTAAYVTGRLTCVVFEGTRRALLEV